MKRLALAVTACVAALLLTLPLSGQAAYKTGISDQVASIFQSPNFKPLKTTTARYITPWDVANLPASDANRVNLDAWIAGARSAGQDPLIAFEHSHTKGREKSAPSASQFRAALVKFLRTHKSVRSISPWNEVNRCNRTIAGQGTSLVVGQPRKLCSQKTGPKLAAGYYKAARSACASVKRNCRIVALDILDQNNVTSAVRYVRSFIRFARPFPKIWGIHNYSDTNRFSTKRTRALLNATRRGEVWLTETGGIVRFGKSFPFSTSRAAKALGCMFTIAKSNKRIKRLYIYNYGAADAGGSFDSGLVNADDSRRPGWTVVQKRKARACRK